MEKFRRWCKPVSPMVIFGLLVLSVHVPVANAALVGTEAAIAAARAQPERDRITSLLQREDVAQRLHALGVDPDAAQVRIARLSDAEIETLAAKMDQLPAGGGDIGVLVFLFVLLLITDILGLTDIFPFVKKPVRR